MIAFCVCIHCIAPQLQTNRTSGSAMLKSGSRAADARNGAAISKQTRTLLSAVILSGCPGDDPAARASGT
jgi:hypothetical protein